MKSRIVAVNSTYDEVYENLESALDSFAEFTSKLNTSRVISIKINLCDARTPDTGAITDPVFLDALLRYLRKKCGDSVEINVVESEATVAMPNLFIEWFGFVPVLKKWGASFVNLSKDKTVIKEIDGLAFKKFAVPSTIARSDVFISLSKLKTIGLTKITCALKNQFGCIPRKKKIDFHRSLDNVIVDANLVMRPDLSIVDGIIAHVGSKGPAFGRPVPANLIVIGNDPVATDSFCAKVFGFNPYFVGHIRKAAKAKIGVLRGYDVVLRGFSETPRVNSEFNLPEVYFIKMAVGLFKRNNN